MNEPVGGAHGPEDTGQAVLDARTWSGGFATTPPSTT